MTVAETSLEAYRKAQERGTISQNKYRMLKATVLYYRDKGEWPTAKQAFRYLAETHPHVDPLNQSAYQPRLTNDLPEMGMVEEHSIENNRTTWKPTQKGLQALSKAEK